MLKRFQRIVVGLDGSDHARKALGIAVEWARLHKSALLMVHALEASPLSDDERKLAETEFGMQILGERPPAATVGDPGRDPRMGLAAVPGRPAYGPLTARTQMMHSLLEEMRQDAQQQGVEKVEICIESGEPADVILDIAGNAKADLIVIGSRGLSDLQGLVFGSTAHKVAHRASCTCLTVS